MKKLFSSFCGLLLLSSCLAPTGAAQSIPPDTQIQVQLLDPLDTGKTQAGQEFSATLASPIQLSDGAVWPKGTEVQGKVVDVVSSGRLSRPASITLQLTQIGESPIIEAVTAQIDGKSHAGRNVALIGGVAAVGAILGGIAGGGKGAAIGTAAGAGAGTLTAAATGKQEIVLPAETPITFVLASDAAREPEPSGPAPESYEAAQLQDPTPDFDYYEPYAPEQLDNLLAPIALYPDPLLAQVLVAATFPDQIQDAAPWVRVHSSNSIDYQPWDVSVKAVAHYPTVLSMLDDQLDWTTALGQAYVYQSTDIMLSVQRLRHLAYSRGNLIPTRQQRVILSGGYIQIVPAQARLIFVPVYDPGVIYVRRVYRSGVGFGSFYTFGRGSVIGAWLNYDVDWGSRRVVYDGWDPRRGGWRAESRPYVHITNVYVNNRYEIVNVNRTVVNRHVNYHNVERYKSVHRDVTYENHSRFEANRVRNQPPRAGQQPRPQPVNERANERRIQSQPRPQPRRPDNASFGRTNQAPPRMEEPRSEPLKGRPNDQGVQNQIRPAEERSPQPQRPTNASFGRTNQTPPKGEQPRPQPPAARVNDGGNDRSIRNEPPARPEPARTAPQPPPKVAPAAPPAAHPSSENQPRAQPQQRQRNSGNEGNPKSNKEKDNSNKGDDNGGDTK